MRGFIEGRGGDDAGTAQHVPYESPNTLRSKATARIIDILSEGPCGGLVDGLKSVKLNGTPVQGPDVSGRATYNFQALNIQTRKGTQTQAAVGGFAATEAEIPSGAEIKAATPVTVTIADSTIDRCRLLLSFQSGLSSTNDAGELVGTTVDLKIEVQSNGGAWVQDHVERVTGKSTTRYQRSSTIRLAKFGPAPWNIRVSRLTMDAPNIRIVDKSYLASYTLIKDGKLRYPNTALAGIEADAISFSSIPVRSYVIRGMLVRVPSNYTPREYDPGTDTWSVASYTGEWDGNFKTMWTDNPAWCFYDLLVEKRYGLGEFLNAATVDKWSLYNIGKYCDELVPDGRGGEEPRFTCNLCLNSQEDAYQVITGFASIFRGMAYWAAGQVYATQDRPTDPTYAFSESNVLDGLFTYSSASRRARHNVVIVAWNDPSDSYRQKLEYVEDAEDIAESGKIVDTQILAYGCTSRSQALRCGLWRLYTEKYEGETVTFRTAMENALVMPGDRVHIMDQSRVSQRLGGRLLAGTTTAVTLDSPVTLELGETYTIWCALPDGTIEEQAVTNTLPYTGAAIATAPFSVAPAAEAQWVLSSSSLQPQIFRILHVKQSDKDTAEILAIKHNPSKFALIDAGVDLEDVTDGTVDLRTPADPPTGLTLGEFQYIAGTGVKTALSIGWTGAATTSTYGVDYQKNNGPWESMPQTSSCYAEVLDVTPGNFAVRVTAYNARGIASPSISGTYEVLGKLAPPEDVTGFTVEYSPFGATLVWQSVADEDLEGYEIREGAAWASGTIINYGAATRFPLMRTSGSLTYWIKAKDTSGNYSVNAVSVSVVITPTTPTSLAMTVSTTKP